MALDVPISIRRQLYPQNQLPLRKKKRTDMARILITGVAGFIGSNLADRLIKDTNNKVIGIDNLAYGVREQVPESVEFHCVDIRSKEIYPLFRGIDYVFHFAAKNSI